MNTINDQWRMFDGIMMPKDATTVQRNEARLAFYAGAEGVLRILFIAGGKDTSEAAGVAILDGLHQECKMFSREWGIKRGLPPEIVDLIAPIPKRGTST